MYKPAVVVTGTAVLCYVGWVTLDKILHAGIELLVGSKPNVKEE